MIELFKDTVVTSGRFYFQPALFRTVKMKLAGMPVADQPLVSIPRLSELTIQSNEAIRDEVLEYMRMHEPMKLWKALGIEFNNVYQDFDLPFEGMHLLHDIINLPVQDYTQIDLGVFGHRNPSREEAMNYLYPFSDPTAEDIQHIRRKYIGDTGENDVEEFFESRTDSPLEAWSELENEEFNHMLYRYIFNRINVDIVPLNKVYWPQIIQEVNKHVEKYKNAV